MDEHSLVVNISDSGLSPVLEVRGEIDLASETTLRDAIRAVSESVVVLDLSAVDFIDSTGIRLLVSEQTRLIKEGRSLILVTGEGEGSVQRLLELTGLSDAFEAISSVEELGRGGLPR